MFLLLNGIIKTQDGQSIFVYVEFPEGLDFIYHRIMWWQRS